MKNKTKILSLKVKKFFLIFWGLFLFPMSVIIGSENRNTVKSSSLELLRITGENVTQQKKQITGKVSDTNGTPIPGVTVTIKGTAIGTATDIDGHYSLNNVSENDVLLFSFVGMKPNEIAIGTQAIINLTLEEESIGLEEVVAIGYGKQSRSSLTTSISKLDTKVLDNIPYANIGTALQGTLSGVVVQSITGQPGASPRIIIRGGTSIVNPNGAVPLYVIDGIIRPNMNDINPEEVESIQVLKDAAATSIYGARASNGVVIITTKSGKAGQNLISYNYSLIASDMLTNLDLVGSRDYINFWRKGVMASAIKKPSLLDLLNRPWSAGTGNDLTNRTGYMVMYLTPDNKYKLNEGWQSMPDPFDETKTIIFGEEDWQNLTFRTAISHNHTLSASGGTEKATYNVGLGYLNNEGIAIGSSYKRMTLDMNGSLKVKDNLNVFGRLSYANVDQKDNWNWNRPQYAAPTMKYKFEDGTLSPGMYFPSAEYTLSKQDQKDINETNTISFGINWNILPNLSFDPQISRYSKKRYYRSFTKEIYDLFSVVTNSNRPASTTYSALTNQQADAVLTYFTSLNDHFIEAKAGFSYFKTDNTSFSASGRYAATDLIPTLNASAEPTGVNGFETEQVVAGYFGRIIYNYKQKYLATVNGRYDGASNLGGSYKWGFFPGISLGWNIHEENFWDVPSNLISSFKLRGSYGVNGNISGLGPYQAQGTYGVGSKYGGYGAIQNAELANSELQWEQSKTFDIGMDVGFLNNRILLIGDIYRRVTNNLLTTYSLPLSTGFSSVLTNLGALENKGVEAEISASVFPSTSDFQWQISLTAAYVKNKILELPSNGVENNRIGGYYVWDPKINDYNWLGGLQEGGTMGDFYVYKQIGIYKTDEEAQNGPVDMLIPFTDKTKFGGDVNWLDADGNGLIDDKDRVYVGNQYPKLSGGFNNSISYKNFNLVLRTDFLTGHTLYNYIWAENLACIGAMGGILSAVKDSWQKPGDITNIPRYYYADQGSHLNIHRGNSEFYEKGDYLAIRELTLAYNIPKRIFQKTKINIENLRFNLTGNNLGYITAYRGLNPEIGGTDSGGYRLPRNVIFGINISF